MKKLEHVAIIVDGNGRWASEKGLPRKEGHKMGSHRIDTLFPYIFEKGIKVLSLYIFSTENFKRSEDEVNNLMDLFIKKFKSDFKSFQKKNIKIVFSGRREPLREDVLKAMDEIKEKTKNNKGGIINFCINYGSHSEIVDACKKIATLVKNDKLKIEDINEEIVENNLYQVLPPVDLLIRPGKEIRLSNFLLWQISYAELYFTNVYFPDFDNNEFDKACDSYYKRDRRFGKVNDKKNH